MRDVVDDGGLFVGTLAHTTLVPSLNEGTRIVFHPHHVAEVSRPMAAPPAQPWWRGRRPWLFAIAASITGLTIARISFDDQLYLRDHGEPVVAVVVDVGGDGGSGRDYVVRFAPPGGGERIEVRRSSDGDWEVGDTVRVMVDPADPTHIAFRRETRSAPGYLAFWTFVPLVVLLAVQGFQRLRLRQRMAAARRRAAADLGREDAGTAAG